MPFVIGKCLTTFVARTSGSPVPAGGAPTGRTSVYASNLAAFVVALSRSTHSRFLSSIVR